MCRPEEIQEKENRIQELLPKFQKKLRQLLERADSGNATPDDLREIKRLKRNLGMLTNTG